MGKIIAISNMKGGTGKTMTAASISMGLAHLGKKILCIDSDPQGSLSISFGITNLESCTVTLPTVMTNIIHEAEFEATNGFFKHPEGVDLLPANSTLANIQIILSGLMGRETVLRQYIDKIKSHYDYIIIDCAPSIDLLTINALTAADSVIIPVVPKYLDAKGLELLLKSISQIRRHLNPSLTIDGILLTMVNSRGNFTKKIIQLIESAYEENINIFKEHIPCSIRAAESAAQGISIFNYNSSGKVAKAYSSLALSILTNDLADNEEITYTAIMKGVLKVA